MALGLRDRAILELLYSTGIRKRELANLTAGEFRLESHELLILSGKGGKDRVVPAGGEGCHGEIDSEKRGGTAGQPAHLLPHHGNSHAA